MDLAHDECAQIVRHRRFDLETHDIAQPALFQTRLELANEIFGLFLNFDVAIADHAKRTASLDFVTRKQLFQEQRDGVFQREETTLQTIARRQVHLRVRQRNINEARNLARHWDQRVEGASISLAPQLQRDRKAQVRNERKRVRRIDRERGQQWKHFSHEQRLQIAAFFVG